jgi:hypothetical protein
MSAVVLLDNGLPAGFLLFAGSGRIEPTAARACTIMAPPFPIPSAARDMLSERKHVEFSATVTDEANDSLRIAAQLKDGAFLRVHLPISGLGTWCLSAGPSVVASGACERAARK